MKQKLNKRIVRQIVRGYKSVNRFTAVEERAWVSQLTEKEARAMFIELCKAWEHGGARAGGNLKAIERLRIAETIRAQRPFAQIVRRMKKR
ncbi:MAG: hypothetical protein HY868_19025 [Chloroflexi bacterium]|nr:hypothetical protein [Chloroflexota bacterium]